MTISKRRKQLIVPEDNLSRMPFPNLRRPMFGSSRMVGLHMSHTKSSIKKGAAFTAANLGLTAMNILFNGLRDPYTISPSITTPLGIVSGFFTLRYKKKHDYVRRAFHDKIKQDGLETVTKEFKVPPEFAQEIAKGNFKIISHKKGIRVVLTRKPPRYSR